MSVVFSPSLLLLEIGDFVFRDKAKNALILYVVTAMFAVTLKSNTFFNTTLIPACFSCVNLRREPYFIHQFQEE